jgi:hypothetical protein
MCKKITSKVLVLGRFFGWGLAGKYAFPYFEEMKRIWMCCLVLAGMAILSCGKVQETRSDSSNQPSFEKPRPKKTSDKLPNESWSKGLPGFVSLAIPNGEGRPFHNINGNFLFIPTAGFAWAALKDLATHGEEIELTGLRSTAQSFLNKLNVFKPVDYGLGQEVIISGAGRTNEDVNQANARISKAFPGLAFKIDSLDVGNHHVFAYSVLRQNLRYFADFEEKEGKFQGKNVKGFGTKGSCNWVQIWRYESEDRFAMSIRLKRGQGQLFIAKGLEIGRKDRIVKLVDSLDEHIALEMTSQDEFWAPEIGLRLKASYPDFVGHLVGNDRGQALGLNQFEESCIFKMDRKGVELEGSSYLSGKDAIKAGGPAKPKQLILNKPYWIILKQRGAKEPYFMLCVRNTALMMPLETP